MASPLADLFQSARRLVTNWQLLATVSVLAVLCLGYLAFAVDLWLAEYLGPSAAAAATAGLLVLVALAVIGIAAVVTGCAPKAVPLGRSPDATNIADMAAMLISLSEKLDAEARSSAKPLTIAALVIGCVVGYSPALQKKLKEMVG